MYSVNQSMLLGNVTRDPELRYTPGGNPVIGFSVATNRQWFDKETQQKKEAVEYHNIVFWGKAAEIIGQFVSKGDKIYIQGRLQTRSWEKDGVKRYSTEVVGQDFVLLTPKGQPKAVEGSEPVEVKPAEEVKPKEPGKESKENEINPDDIPF